MTPKDTHEPADRRPIASRELGWIKAISRTLVGLGVRPNGISVSSTVFAVVGAAAIVATPHHVGLETRLLWLAGALCVQLRLLANLFDGMVALESGAASPVGELFNEVPDRISDAVLLVALGFVKGSAVHLGYSAAILAVFVAYVRAMGGVAGAGQVFAGVMAKPQRMFLVTMLCLFQALAPTRWIEEISLFGFGVSGLTLAAICLGCVFTGFSRLATLSRKLRSMP